MLVQTFKLKKNAGRAVIDASKQVCQTLFSSSSCGYSEHKGIKALISSELDSHDYGYFEATPEEMIEMEKYSNRVMSGAMLD